jgi:hypothetical protein
VLAPQPSLAELRMRLSILSILRTRLLCHDLHVLLKRQPGAVEPFDRHLLETTFRMPDVKLLVGNVDKEHHLLPCQLLFDVVRLVIDRDVAIRLHFTAKRLWLEPLQPPLWINVFRNTRQRGIVRTDDTWEVIVAGTRLVGAFVLGVKDKALRSLSDLLQRAGTMHQQAFMPQRAMKSFDIRVFIGPMRWTDVRLNAQAEKKAHQG